MAQHRHWHAIDVAQAFQVLNASPEGLTEAEIRRRLAQYGPNAIEAKKKTSKLALLFDQLKNPLVVVLVAAAAISLLAGEIVDAIVVGVVLLINTLIGFYQEYRAEEAIEALKARAAPEAEVLRCWDAHTCTEMRVRTADIVPGDVILLEAGDKIPADARIVQAANLEVDESMLTGESLPVRKKTEPLPEALSMTEWTNVVFAGTIVTYGRGRAVVFATGSATEMGRIATLIEETEKAESPLHRQTARLGRNLSFLALAVSILTFVLGLVRGFAMHEMLLFALASAVSSIPEGLPAVMTITLAVGVNRMASRNAIIRRLRAVDTLGAATVICTDKTGTLTTNQMTVQRIYVDGKMVEVSGVGFAPEGDFRHEGKPIGVQDDASLEMILRAVALCNDAHLVRHVLEEGYRWEVRGDPTEGALVVAAEKAGVHKEALEEERPRIDETPFSASTRYMATFHARSRGEVEVYVKGAPETILGMCGQMIQGNRELALSEDEREAILAANTRMASAALRVLAVAYRTIDAGAVERVKGEIEAGRDGLTFAGLVGMMDPPRLEVPEAVARCKGAGIRVVMATGDHQLTGGAIARQVGILRQGGHVLAGDDVERMSDQALDEAIGTTDVFARVSPQHKHRIVESLRRTGHVVAMTGDGVNDAPALEASEIGVAMGIAGTDVTRETADMVLTDDNFASIVNAVEEGRVVFQNLRKVTKFLISTNIGEDLTILASLVLFACCEPIITAVQILWVNLVTDGLLDITIAMEPQEGDVMHQPPRKPGEAIINREILMNVLFVSAFMAIGTLGVFAWASSTTNAHHARTMAFTTLAMFQVFNSLNCRSRTQSVFRLGLLSNVYLVGAIALSITLQVLANRLPFLQAALGTEPLALQDWGLIVLISSSVFAADEVRKLVQSKTARK
jgi:Ca2+-transporting ATPase